MRYKSLLCATVSFFAISSLAYAGLEDQEKSTCENLGYNTDTSECISKGAIPLICPFYETGKKKSLCVTKSCRGYPLWKEGSKYMHLNASGTPVEAKPSIGDLFDYVQNGSSGLEKCEAGLLSDNREYFRIKDCKTTAVNGAIPVYQNDICDVGCDRQKYPFDTHPGNLAGTVEECVDKDGTYYGYTQCNDGWIRPVNDPNSWRCELNSCDIKVYPYVTDPNLTENRGPTATCKVGANAYYRYTSCNSGFALREAAQGKGGICVKTCLINSSACSSHNAGDYKDWTCTFTTSNCRVGDLVAINNAENVIGVIINIGDRTLIVPDKEKAFETRKWGNGAAETIDITTIPNITAAQTAREDMAGKEKTSKIKQAGSATDYPAAYFCIDYQAPKCTQSGLFCSQGEWYLPALGELGYMYDNRYILYNVLGSARLYDTWFWSSTENGANNAWYLYFNNGNRGNPNKYGSNYVRPVLAF